MDESCVETSLCRMMLLEITGYSLLEASGGQSEGERRESRYLEGYGIHMSEPGPPAPRPQPAAGVAPPLQPGHTQVAVITAPESLGERVVLNFQLRDLSGVDTRQSHRRGRGLGWTPAPSPTPGAFQTPGSRAWGRCVLLGSLASLTSLALGPSTRCRPSRFRLLPPPPVLPGFSLSSFSPQRL